MRAVAAIAGARVWHGGRVPVNLAWRRHIALASVTMRRTFRMGSLPTRMIVTHPALNGRRWRPE